MHALKCLWPARIVIDHNNGSHGSDTVAAPIAEVSLVPA
jgi:hypothetical protein